MDPPSEKIRFLLLGTIHHRVLCQRILQRYLGIAFFVRRNIDLNYDAGCPYQQQSISLALDIQAATGDHIVLCMHSDLDGGQGLHQMGGQMRDRQTESTCGPQGMIVPRAY